jgi:hypothetical protein
MADPPLHDDEPGARARRTDPETSHKAARSLSRATISRIGKQLMWAISLQPYDQGMTSFELEEFFKNRSDKKMLKELTDCLVGFFRHQKDEKIFRQSVHYALEEFIKRRNEEEMLRQSITPRRVELLRMVEFRYDAKGEMLKRVSPKSHRGQGAWFLTPLGREMLTAWLAVWQGRKK